MYSKVNDYSKERHKVITYFEIGKLLNEAGGKYGNNIIEEQSKKIVIDVGKKYNRRTLFRKKKFYIVFINEKKVTELKKEHTGQIMTYMNYIDKNIKTIEENEIVGIIICKQDNEYVIKYCSDERIIAREYELVLKHDIIILNMIYLYKYLEEI